MSEHSPSVEQLQRSAAHPDAPLSSQVLVLNGPNLGALGARTPEVYGTTTMAELAEIVASVASDRGLTAEVRQTDDEAELISWIYEAIADRRPVVLNPAAFTHYSYGLADAAVQLPEAGVPLVEVHISNPAARESFRHRSVISAVATGTIAGFGLDSYVLAIEAIARIRGQRG
ncbi:type II 3-dehydroquinate dehydratase [Pseudoclavibacter soli]|uniref:type II 3-dehydroquinate dehydratase n=1 Tax=Pseudoclavibacter soli TaxID=452623 RepID=UPI00040B0E1B|nr:type II 3-dehydroquinate dehydratase [Pseudoclavibacter soli]